MKTQKHWMLIVACLLIAGIRAQEAPPEPITIGEALRVESKKLNETREIHVYPPVSYAKSKQRYPVIYTLDGEVSGPTVASAARFMSGASAIPQMPEALVIFHDYAPNIIFSAPQLPRPWDKVKEVALGSAAPDWRLKTAEGKTVALSELRGEVVVLDFWANWCGPCRKLEPLFDQLAQEYQSKPVKFFTMSIWPDRDFNPQAYLKGRKMASTFLIGEDAVAKDYGIWGLPIYYVIDPEGKVSYIHVLLSVNSESLEKRLREAIEKALSNTEQEL